MHRAGRLSARRLAAVTAAATLATTSALAVPAFGATSPGTSPAATTATCALGVGGYCRVSYAADSSQATVSVPGSLSTVTVLVTGASGGSASTTGPGGASAVVLAELPVPPGGGQLSVTLGQQGSGSSGGTGWSSGGGPGSPSSDAYLGGAGGGGSTAIGWTSSGTADPEVVAGGGGGGGGNVSDWSGVDTPSYGGAGGTAGDPGEDGGPGSAPDASNADGGPASGSGMNNGQAGNTAVGNDASTGGGGGGGGYQFGGAGGGAGGIGQCNIRGKCPPDAAPGAGGGGGGGRSFVAADAQAVFTPVFATSIGKSGSVTVFGSTVQANATCTGSSGVTTSIPSGVSSYGVLMLGGSGTQGSNQNDTEGHGAAVSGIVDVSSAGGQLNYFIGCQGGNGGGGYGAGGGHGTAHSHFSNDGGIGGGSSELGITNTATILLGAGGGGGSGGDFNCVAGDSVCENRGGVGGDGGGLNGTTVPFDGAGGNGPADLGGGDGGCAGCESTPNGSVGGHSKYGGGGGGGGGGVTAGGAGGWGADFGSGGGGGAGSSYLNLSYVSATTFGTQTDFGDGAMYLIPITTTGQPATAEQAAAMKNPSPAATGHYRISATLTGDDARSHHGTTFVFDQSCTLGGARLSAKAGTSPPTLAYLKAGASVLSPALPVGAVCTIRAVETSHATRVLPAIQRVVIGAASHAVTFTFGYDTAKLVAVNTSTGRSATFVDIVSCTYGDSRAGKVRLPGGGGFVAAHGFAVKTYRVPVGAQCRIDQSRSKANRNKLAAVDGTRWLTVSAAGANHLSVVDILRTT